MISQRKYTLINETYMHSVVHIDDSLLTVIICLCIINMSAFKTCHVIGLKVGRHDIFGLKLGSLEYVAVQSCCSPCISVVTVCYAAAHSASLLFVTMVYLYVFCSSFNDL